jgi:REP element-mobilizing transposase RayT
MTSPFEKNSPAFAYFITIRTYATWLHGDQRGSVDSKHNKFGTPSIKSSHKLHDAMKQSTNEDAFLLNEKARETVLQSMMQTCHCLNWRIFAIHVRTNHVHLVIQSHLSKEETAKKLKQYATKDLKKYHTQLQQRNRFWARHASTKNIWAPETLFPALYYVIKQQGEPMALYYDKQCYDPVDEALYECYFKSE